MATCFRVTQFILRVFEFIFAIVAFAAAAWLLNNSSLSGDSPTFGIWSLTKSAVQFMVFTGVTAFLISLLYMVVYFVEGLQRTLLGVVELVLNVLWSIFWLAAAASFAAEELCKPTYRNASDLFTNCGTFLASSAFAWMSWILWMVSLVLSVADMKRGDGITGGAKKYPMGTAPQV